MMQPSNKEESMTQTKREGTATEHPPEPIAQLPIEWHAHNYMAFSVIAPHGDDEKEAALDAIRESENALFDAASDDEARARVDDGMQTGFTVYWGRTTAEMAASLRQAADWLDAVPARFPGHIITTDID